MGRKLRQPALHPRAKLRPGLYAIEWKPGRIAEGEYSVRLQSAGRVIVKKVRVERERVEAAE